MFKIPTYDELENKEKEQDEKRSEFKQNLFQKRKLINLNDTRDNFNPEKEEQSEKIEESVKKICVSQPTLKPCSSKNQEDEDDELLAAFICQNKEIIEKPVLTSKPDDVFKKPDVPTLKPTITLKPSSSTVSSSSFGGGSLIVNAKQRGNPVLKHIRNVQWRFSDTLVPDYCMSRSSCAFYLSMKYHLLNPTYIHQRIRELGKAYDLRVLLTFVDVKEPRHCIKELEKICIYSNFTMILCWTPEEVGRYLETYKAYEFKSADIIMEKSTNQIEVGSNTKGQNSSDTNFINNLTDFLCQIKSINKTDASTLRQTFGSVKELSKATKDQLNLCPGLGPLKCNRVYDILRTPFLLPKKN
ncbi:DNA excision repair ERCC-1 [Brachionus plicatilis]|uniref:DNA excision repair ERCC-1 n=1 Tax=Brachionus plicatilis TaxID=10195 RepID=A0A3M7QWJ5_BRAPC|nr:DNA excision repair ERCC-1 [Brachionus plicatilis]